MEPLRKHRAPPYSVAVVHGGPGAGGEMAPVARELSRIRGVLEPIQTASSIQGQVDELKSVLEQCGDPPAVVIGFSWGAWLSYLLAAEHPTLVKKLILVGSGAFEEAYGHETHVTRLGRFSPSERQEFESLAVLLSDSESVDREAALARLGKLCTKTDAYDPVPEEPGCLDVRTDIFLRVWHEAVKLRASGELLDWGRRIACPVIAIHGDYDPHPSEGVRLPLSRVIPRFRFILLTRCGHKPWIERRAKEDFYRVLEEVLA